ncbi:MAG: methyltransferase domain-containing protein [Acidobacteria bacterium]|nr:methyltransferase domain-containing protein [Acidobacteriota bacterium]
MRVHDLDLLCPFCRALLVEPSATDRRLACPRCGRSFPIILGIPDLRIRSDPFIDLEGDRAKGIELEEKTRGLRFLDSVDLYYRLATKVPASQAALFRRGLVAAAARAAESVREWERRTERALDGPVLDIGCGTAPLAVAASRCGVSVVGVDIAFRWLVMARKRMEEAGVEVPLVCACAEALPFQDGAFQSVAAESVIEQVFDQTVALTEMARVLRAGGRLFLSTPNRFSLGPDPHVGIWGGGYLPERLIDRYVQRRGGNPPHRRLVSARGLRHLLEESGFTDAHIYPPSLAAQATQIGGALKLLAQTYSMLRRTSGGRSLLVAIGPLLHSAARKPPELTGVPTPGVV